MCRCVCVSVSVCVYLHICVDVCVYFCTCVFVCVFAFLHVFVFACVCIHLDVHFCVLFELTCVSLHVCTGHLPTVSSHPPFSFLIQCVCVCVCVCTFLVCVHYGVCWCACFSLLVCRDTCAPVIYLLEVCCRLIIWPINTNISHGSTAGSAVTRKRLA